MAAVLTLTISDPSLAEIQSEILSLTFNIATPIDERIVQNLNAGDNTIACPAGATLCVIDPPPNNAQALKEKSTGTDGGEPRGTNLPWYVILNGQTSFVINAAGAVANCVFHFL